MAAPTTLDFANSNAYAYVSTRKWNFDKKNYPYLETDVYWDDKRPSLTNDPQTLPYYCPPALRPCPTGGMRFTRTGCNSVSCYPYDETGASVHPRDNRPSGMSKYCFDVFKRWKPEDEQPNTDVPYLEWHIKRNECVRADQNLRRFALVPSSRRPTEVVGVTDAPQFIYHPGDSDNPIELTRTYCEDYMKVSYDAGAKECYIGNGQYLAEIFMGTLWRELN